MINSIGKIKIAKLLIFISLFAILTVPVFSFAQDKVPVDAQDEGLVPCGDELYAKGEKTVKVNGKDVDMVGLVKNPCGFKHFIILVNTVINFILFGLVLPICAIMFAYAGFLFLTSVGNPSQRTKAKKIFFNVILGFIIAIAAWVIVKTVLTLLGYDGAWIGF